MKRSIIAPLTILLLGGCDGPPSAGEIRTAYLQHLKRDAVEAQLFGGADGDHAGILISVSPKRCDDDGGGHYHCVVRFAVERSGERGTLDRSLHLVREADAWAVDAVEDASEADRDH